MCLGAVIIIYSYIALRKCMTFEKLEIFRKKSMTIITILSLAYVLYTGVVAIFKHLCML